MKMPRASVKTAPSPTLNYDPCSPQNVLYMLILVQAYLVVSHRCQTTLNTKPTVSDQEGAKELMMTEGKVDFRDAKFAYDSRRPNIWVTVYSQEAARRSLSLAILEAVSRPYLSYCIASTTRRRRFHHDRRSRLALSHPIQSSRSPETGSPKCGSLPLDHPTESPIS
jgi:hypothetical protein